MAEWSKALRSGRSPLLWAWVRIPLLTKILLVGLVVTSNFLWSCTGSRVAQWKRAGPITQRSVDRNYALLVSFFSLPTHDVPYPVRKGYGTKRCAGPISAEDSALDF